MWKVLTAQPCAEARWHSSHLERFPTAGARKFERLPIKLPMFDKIVELMKMPVKNRDEVTFLKIMNGYLNTNRVLDHHDRG